ncbi:carbohydrate-binding protein [Pyxidicoccus sp. MSG2]|uniref:carbohydrate-binding protein n=1 Tax=Pyxidicoccus sp. MSG2 TaxID=2996790 RepID=UPI00226E4866|nr:carbohydrate-binding protein [Pyxidicoccus sp. MSG2]MCY1014565.1 carbohydrate-binding protein [Pyxidicoccus sp. MSG2]
MKKHLRSLSAALFFLLPAVAAAETTWVMNASVPVVGAGGGYVFYQFQLNTGVWPVAPGHTVGVVYTWDHWQTAQWGTLSWQSNQSNAYGSQDEVWRGAFNIPPNLTFTTVEYAIYVDDASGHRTWNNNNGQNFSVTKAN